MSYTLTTLAWAVVLDPGPKLVLLSLCDQANDHGQCFPSRAHIAKRTGFGVRAVQTHLNALKDAGLVTTYRRGPKGSGFLVSLEALRQRSADSAHLSEKEVQILPKRSADSAHRIYKESIGTHTARARVDKAPSNPVPPTLAEIVAYCAEIGSPIDPERFLSRNAATGWHVGGQPVRDWRALLRAWEPFERQTPHVPGEKHAPHRESAAERFERLNNTPIADLIAPDFSAPVERAIAGEVVSGDADGVRNAVVIPIFNARGHGGRQAGVVG